MIVGMNQRPLMCQRRWAVYLWAKRRHWSVVLQPLDDAFQARLVDDFVHNAKHCFSAEVPSCKLFLVYELLVDHGQLFLMLSVKPDFIPGQEPVQFLGISRGMHLQDLQENALAVIRRYKSYSYIGCNCQHFASDFASTLGVTCKIIPDDEAVAHAASNGALAVGAAGVTVAAAAATGAAGASVLSSFASPALLGSMPVFFTTVAATACAISMVSGAALAGIAGSYRAIYDGLRDSEGDDEIDEEHESEVEVLLDTDVCCPAVGPATQEHDHNQHVLDLSQPFDENPGAVEPIGVTELCADRPLRGMPDTLVARTCIRTGTPSRSRRGGRCRSSTPAAGRARPPSTRRRTASRQRQHQSLQKARSLSRH